jgi:phosphoribosylformimino-5-aminoimidazole carboxamide ribotide isomerase
MIEIIPGIDIINGQCVRLQQGDYSKLTIYEKDPVMVARRFEDIGIKRVHLVDLDGAKEKHVVNLKVLEKIASKTKLVIDFGGGVKSEKDLISVLNAGACMVTVGSLAVTDKKMFFYWLKKYGSDKIILGADVKNRKIAISGWLKTTETELTSFLEEYTGKGIKNVLCTDISRDGMLTGTALELYGELREKFPGINLIASGGIGNIQEVHLLNEMNVNGVVIGKAIYEQKIKLPELQPFLKE